MAIITLNGSPMHTIGDLPTVGTLAHDFTVTKTDLGEINLKSCIGKKIILNIFPSLDTPTCASAMRHFNDIAAQMKNSVILCISADLPFAQKRFCTAEHLDNLQPVSVFRHHSFGKDYGVLITDGPLKGLLARSIVLIDEHGKIIYTEMVKEISNEPDYAGLLKLLNLSFHQP